MLRKTKQASPRAPGPAGVEARKARPVLVGGFPQTPLFVKVKGTLCFVEGGGERLGIMRSPQAVPFSCQALIGIFYSSARGGRSVNF